LLKQVSRSFHLTLRALPRVIRPQISLAYLLARATDTVADTALVPVPQRLAALAALRDRLLGRAATMPDFAAFLRDEPAPAAGGGTDAERALLCRLDEAVAALEAFSAADQERIRAVLETILSGQELDLRRFGGASAERIVALRTDDELDDYTYRVAGCVGEFWTRVCRAHLFPRAPLDEARLLAQGVRFGKGLQLVNVLRDLPADLRQGRCYLPVERLSPLGLQPADLLDNAAWTKLRPFYHECLDRAREHLAAGWDYTNALPRGNARVRLACAWPVLIGVKTLARLRAANPLDAGQRVKISRAEVRGIIVRSVWSLPWPGAWRGQFERAAG
jgi:farnesyl-diphosphate farnesyltransferase